MNIYRAKHRKWCLNRAEEVLMRMDPTVLKTAAAPGAFTAYTLRDFPSKLMLIVKIMNLTVANLALSRNFIRFLYKPEGPALQKNI